jgi:transcriptional regulator with XRE-family HTH domain
VVKGGVKTMNIGKTIIKARKAKGISRKQLAEGLGVSYETVRQWEINKTHPRHKLYEPLAQKLGMDVAQLLTGQTPTTERPAKYASKLRKVFAHMFHVE